MSTAKITDETNGICKYRVCASRNAPPWTSPARHVESSGGYPSVLALKISIQSEQAASDGPAPETTIRKDARRTQNGPKAYCAGWLCVGAASRSRRGLVPKWLDGKSLRFVQASLRLAHFTPIFALLLPSTRVSGLLSPSIRSFALPNPPCRPPFPGATPLPPSAPSPVRPTPLPRYFDTRHANPSALHHNTPPDISSLSSA